MNTQNKDLARVPEGRKGPDRLKNSRAFGGSRLRRADLVGKISQVVTAGAGFFAGYLFGVDRWAAIASTRPEALLRTALVPGLVSSAVYAVLLGLLFWTCIPTPRASGLRAVTLPAAFTLSLAVGALGIQLALSLVG